MHSSIVQRHAAFIWSPAISTVCESHHFIFHWKNTKNLDMLDPWHLWFCCFLWLSLDPSGGPQPEWRRSTEGIKVKQIAHSTATPGSKNLSTEKKITLHSPWVWSLKAGKNLQHRSSVKKNSQVTVANMQLRIFYKILLTILLMVQKSGEHQLRER